MAAPAVLGRAGAVQGSDTIAHTITLPASIAAGERLLVIFSVDQADSLAVYPDESFSGTRWEKIGQDSNGVSVIGTAFTKVAEGSDALKLITSTPQQSSHVSLRIEAANRTLAAVTNGSSTNSDPPNLALSEGSPTREVLWIASRSGDAAVVATVAPSGYANLQTQTGGASGASTNTAEKTATLDSENPGTFTSSIEQWVCFTIGVWNGNTGKGRVTQEVAEIASVPTSATRTGRVTQFVVEVVSQGEIPSTDNVRHLIIAT